MKPFNKLISLLSFGLHEKCEESVLNKIIFINLLSFAGFSFFTVFGLIAVFRGEHLHGGASLVTAILMLGSIGYVKRTLRYSMTAQFNLTLVIFFFLFLLSFKQTDSSVILWFPLVPVLSVFILGNRNGGIISFSFLMISVILFLVSDDYTFIPVFSALSTSRLFGLYVALYIISSIVEYYRVNHLRIIEMQLFEAQNETSLKESFISRLSHQIRTPLSNIMLVGHMVNKVNLTKDQKDLIETLIDSANNLVSTIENIAEIAGLDIENKNNLNGTGFNLHAIINNIIRFFTVQKEPIVEFSLSMDEELKQKVLEGEPVRLKQLFLNLIEAILKTRRPGRITISIMAAIHNQTAHSTEIRFEIKTSKPLNLNQRDLKGTPYSEPVAKNHTDLINNPDLIIARKIILQLGGKLHILQTLEKNQVFLFTLQFRPFSPEPEKPAELHEKELIPASPDYKEQLNDASLLLVEDNKINQKIVTLSLKNYIKNIDVANNGKEALDKFGTSKYDIILMDVQMPVIDGFVATKKIREIEATTNSHTPIIAITANALHGDREKCIAAGMDDYISKPFQVEILVEKIKKLLYQ